MGWGKVAEAELDGGWRGDSLASNVGEVFVKTGL